MLKQFVGLYGSLAALASIGLARVRKQGRTRRDEELPTLAVVVAARDEQHNLPDLIASLASQNYPEDKVSFWIVDDDSRDHTGLIARRAAERDKRFHALTPDPDSPIASPKKRALDTAIRRVKAEWIVTTDADCLPRPGWLRAMASFMNEDIGIVLGYSPLVGARHPLQFLLEGESWSSAALCAAAVGLGYPFNAFGRNIAFRRRAYLDLGGYGGDGAIASGDDDLFLQRLTARTNWKASFAADSRAFVPSKVTDANKVYGTKVRHMSVGPRYAAGWIAIGVLGNILFMGLALATVASWLGLASKKGVRAAWVWKWVFDSVMAASASRILGDPFRSALALGTMTAAPFAMWLIWPRALFGNINWKGRRFIRGRAGSVVNVQTGEDSLQDATG